MSANSASDEQLSSEADSLLSPLAHLGLARKGAGAYYSALVKSPDELVRFGAYCQMLSQKVLPPAQHESVIGLSHYAAIKERAFDFFQGALHSALAAEVAATPVENPDITRTALMQAELSFNHAAARDSQVALFHITGNIGELLRAAKEAEELGGWRDAAKWYVTALAIAPVDPHPAAEFYRVVSTANRFDLVDALNKVLARAGLHPFLVGVYGANAMLGGGDAAGCLARLKALQMPSDAAPPALRHARSHALRLAGEANEKLRDFQASYRNYVEMNRLDMAPAIDGKRMSAIARLDAKIEFPKLPPSQRDDVVMLVGFARSGTTLLELVLDSHPEIEAMEEPPTWDAAMARLRLDLRAQPASSSAKKGTAVYETARDIYFSEVDRRRRKPEARLVVDKYPMRSIYAVPLAGILPAQKFIFSIRHPFDVVLSCFRQRFTPNVGMENFRTVKETIEFYDFTMTQWFGVHRLADPLVQYVKYDELVNRFEETVGNILTFMGAKWNDDVRDFASGAQTRSALTPSYQKIRKGLSIGVQSSWRNYGFLFQTPEAKPLYRWAEHFGYDTK